MVDKAAASGSFSGRSRKPKRFVNNESNAAYLKMVVELFQVESGLSDDEISFLDSIAYSWKGNLTMEQAAWVEKIYKRVM